jgi:hypothetical protein
MRNQFGRVIPMGAMGLTIQGMAGEEGIEPSLARFWRPPLCR